MSDDLRALVLELYAAPFTAKVLRGKQAGMSDLTLRLPSATVRRLWAIGREIKAEDAPPIDPPAGPSVPDPDRSPQNREAAGW